MVRRPNRTATMMMEHVTTVDVAVVSGVQGTPINGRAIDETAIAAKEIRGGD